MWALTVRVSRLTELSKRSCDGTCFIWDNTAWPTPYGVRPPFADWDRLQPGLAHKGTPCQPRQWRALGSPRSAPIQSPQPTLHFWSVGVDSLWVFASVADLLSKLVSACKAVSWSQDAVLWRRTVSLLCHDRGRQSGLSHGRIFFKGITLNHATLLLLNIHWTE